MKIAICASEMVPFAKTGGLADVVGALPLALGKKKQEIVIIMPFYAQVRKSAQSIHKFTRDISYADLGENIKVYFIEHDSYFNRDELYADKSGDYKDNPERFSYYCKKSLELLKEIAFSVKGGFVSGGAADIIHCHDWQSALIPVYLKTIYAHDSFYKDTKTLLTIHNIGYQGLFPKEKFPVLGLDWGLFSVDGLEFYGKINLLKGGIVFSDIISTVSQTYSKEIQTKEFGFGLEGVLKKRKRSLFGILNGLDYSIWNPQTDTIITNNYSASDLEGKRKNKCVLQEICNLPVRPDVPLFGIVSRLADQKGFDLLIDAIDAICGMDIQLVILGTGDLKYHQTLARVANRYPQNISLHLKFDNLLAHKIYAGCDIFLMPSRYEPCGLGQLISLRYGAIPLVFKTGGLADTVTIDHGFVFSRYHKDDFSRAAQEAVKAFHDKDRWLQLIKNAMACNFSWEESARQYVQLYEMQKTQRP